MALSEETIALIRHDYEETTLTLVRMGEKFGLAPSYISRLARTGGWRMRSERMGRKPRGKAPLSTEGRALIAHRLRGVLNKKLDQMEKDMESGKLDAADLERDAKSVTHMITGLDKVTTSADGGAKQRSRGEKSAGTGANSDAADLAEVERLQREIIERFERIQRRRDAEGGSE